MSQERRGREFEYGLIGTLLPLCSKRTIPVALWSQPSVGSTSNLWRTYMNMHRLTVLSFAGAAALALSATAQTPAPPSSDNAQTSTPQFYPGTKSSATYPIQNGTLTVNAGMPDHVQSYGPPPPFNTLDANHDGRISEAEAQAYPPLDSDFLYVSGQGKSITRAQYEKWAKDQQP